MVALFLVSTILVVILYRFIPVVVTPLMFIRSVENVKTGGPITWHHTWVSIDEMSSELPVAVIASEDQRFYSHHGFDVEAIEKAAERNRNSSKKFGASTISQQTAKNVFLWPGRSWVRKGFEAYFTLLIEIFWSKDHILEVYLNSIEMGDGIYGAQAVAEQHFGCDAIDLTTSQCALIAATLPNPRKYSSLEPSSYMKRRQSQIIRQMRYVRTLKNH